MVQNNQASDLWLQSELIFDTVRDRYQLVEVSWQNGRRIYGTLLHIDIINNKLWIQQDGTEAGIADDLIALGIPKHQIVLGFKPIDRRKLTEFAVS
ncbi:FdxN element excision controlling factor protein [Tumidithrix helvetica PCC 7403]|uniref:XisI protein n=1 Tax=Tumidithrix helvetica TaxID=3457545 RepID=UPI003C9B4F0F